MVPSVIPFYIKGIPEIAIEGFKQGLRRIEYTASEYFIYKCIHFN